MLPRKDCSSRALFKAFEPSNEEFGTISNGSCSENLSDRRLTAKKETGWHNMLSCREKPQNWGSSFSWQRHFPKILFNQPDVFVLYSRFQTFLTPLRAMGTFYGWLHDLSGYSQGGITWLHQVSFLKQGSGGKTLQFFKVTFFTLFMRHKMLRCFHSSNHKHVLKS